MLLIKKPTNMSSSVPRFYKKCDCTAGSLCHLCDGHRWVHLNDVQARLRCTCGRHSLDCDHCNGMQWIKSDMYRALFSRKTSNNILVRCSGTGCITSRCYNCNLMPCGKCYDATRCNACDGNGWHEPRTVVIGVSFMEEWTETTYEDLLYSFAQIISESSATTE